MRGVVRRWERIHVFEDRTVHLMSHPTRYVCRDVNAVVGMEIQKWIVASDFHTSGQIVKRLGFEPVVVRMESNLQRLKPRELKAGCGNCILAMMRGLYCDELCSCSCGHLEEPFNLFN